MPDSIQERIIKKIAEGLATITMLNGYDNTIASVQRHRWSGVDLSTMPTILVREGDCDVDMANSTHVMVRRSLELFLVVCVRHDEQSDARSGGEILNSYVADIERRIGVSSNWDGLALWTEPPTHLEMEVEAETPHLARGLRTQVIYEHSRYNPFTQT